MIKYSLCGIFGGLENMDLDRDLLHEAESGELSARVYQWDGAWVSLGRNQQPERALVEGCAVPYVMRPTGGKAVLHGHDVTLSIAAPLSRLNIERINPKSVISVYRELAPIIAKSISRCGVHCILGEEGQIGVKDSSTSEDCFMMTSSNDIIESSTGKKVCGCALRLTEHAVLVQASIPAGEPLVQLDQVYHQPAENYFIKISKDDFLAAFEIELNSYFGVGIRT